MANPYQLKTPLVVDVYQEESPVDWARMNPVPYRALLQCTKGQFHADICCGDYIQQCNALGIKYGLYHYLFPNNVNEQAELYKKTVAALGGLGHFPPIVDVEYKPPKVKHGHPDNFPRGKSWATQVKTFLDAIEDWCGQKPMIYTNRYFWEFTFDHTGKPPIWTDEYPLWVAWYPDVTIVDNHNVPRESRMPQGWTKWALWQYSKSGRTDGYQANDYSLVAPGYKATLDAQYP
jgi:lysozyme